MNFSENIGFCQKDSTIPTTKKPEKEKKTDNDDEKSGKYIVM